MESEQESKYEVIITDPAEIGFYEILDYLYDNYELSRAEEIANEIRDTAKSLAYLAKRGAPEPRLLNRKKEYRFVLYERTSRAEVKVIYFIEEESGVVFITDFFPNEMDSAEISARNR